MSNRRNTERIRRHRQTQLKADEIRLLNDIEKYGCHIIHVDTEDGMLGWSYTIGLHDVLQKSELIVVGLESDLAHSLLNEAASRLEQGFNLTEHRQTDLLADVDCEFRSVEQRWLRQLMGYAIWFYQGDEFPTLQCIYPDLNNHFPWEKNFDSKWRARQALLYANNDTVVERDLWSANDPNSSLYDWKFSDSPHTMVFTTKRIMNGDEPILFVYHDADDGAWQFHGESESDIESAVGICFHHVVDRDATLKQLIDLPTGWRATRGDIAETWVREPWIEEFS